MSDYISRQDAIDVFDGVKVDERDCTEYDIGYNDGIDFAISKLSVLPSARKRGEWHLMESVWDNNTWQCSVCGEPYILSAGEPDQNGYCYCPNCGACMKGNK